MRVESHIRETVDQLATPPTTVANLGSGGAEFGVAGGLHIHLDLVPERLARRVGVVANVEQVPLRTSSVDFVLCVGSVLNHGDASAMIREIARIARPNAMIVLEFDSADGLHQGLRERQGDVIPYTTFYNSHMLTLVEYSRSFIEQELAAHGLFVEVRRSFHIISSLLLAMRIPQAIASRLACLDALARRSRTLQYRGSHMLLVARRA